MMEYDDLESIANDIKKFSDKVILIYAFNRTGKTRLSTVYEKINTDSKIHGYCFNSYIEDLFVWNIKEDYDIELEIKKSSLNEQHGLIDIEELNDKLKEYNFNFNIEFNYFDDAEQGIQSIKFYIEGNDYPIKISKGEESLFKWCFIKVLLEKNLSDKKYKYLYIDDPISSLDENHIFKYTESLSHLIKQYEIDKCIISTHHIGFLNMLTYALKRKEITYNMLLFKNKNNKFIINKFNKEIFLFHLSSLKEVEELFKNDKFKKYHINLFRQLLENLASFIGRGNFSIILSHIGYENANEIADNINNLSHRNIYVEETELLDNNDIELYKEIFEKIIEHYKFNI